MCRLINNYEIIQNTNLKIWEFENLKINTMKGKEYRETGVGIQETGVGIQETGEYNTLIS